MLQLSLAMLTLQTTKWLLALLKLCPWRFLIKPSSQKCPPAKQETWIWICAIISWHMGLAVMRGGTLKLVKIQPAKMRLKYSNACLQCHEDEGGGQSRESRTKGIPPYDALHLIWWPNSSFASTEERPASFPSRDATKPRVEKRQRLNVNQVRRSDRRQILAGRRGMED
jgi:hypothetical protein